MLLLHVRLQVVFPLALEIAQRALVEFGFSAVHGQMSAESILIFVRPRAIGTNEKT